MKTYWHFCKLDSTGAPVMRDGTPVVAGERYEIEGHPRLFDRGYHGSEKAIDALEYAPGPWVSKRPLEGVIQGEDQVVGRAYVQQPGVDVTEILRRFARRCALDVIHLWDAPGIVVQYLETGYKSLRAVARDAACDALWSPTKATTWDAALDATLAATWDASWDAAWNAAWNATRAQAAGLDVTWAEAWEAKDRLLTRMLNDALMEGKHVEQDSP